MSKLHDEIARLDEKYNDETVAKNNDNFRVIQEFLKSIDLYDETWFSPIFLNDEFIRFEISNPFHKTSQISIDIFVEFNEIRKIRFVSDIWRYIYDLNNPTKDEFLECVYAGCRKISFFRKALDRVVAQ